MSTPSFGAGAPTTGTRKNVTQRGSANRLTTRERQQARLAADIVLELERRGRRVYEIRFTGSHNKTFPRIILDRECAIATTVEDEQEDHEPVDGDVSMEAPPRGSARRPTQPARTQTAPARSPDPPSRPRVDRNALSARGSAPAAAAQLPAGTTVVGRGRVDKDAAADMVRQFKAVLTPVVRGLGGDERDGGSLLVPEHILLSFGGHKLHKLRVPIGSPAAGMSAQDFGDHLVRLYYGPGMPAVKTGELRQMLTPGATMGSMPSPPPPNAPPTQSSGFSARG